MADSKLSELTAGTSLNASDLFYIVQSGASKRITAANVLAGLNQIKSPPANVKGTAGDKAGMIAFDSSNIYFCVETYSTGVANIWRRVTITTW